MTPITGGKLYISGNFMLEEARDITRLLRAGALPARLTVIETSTFGNAPP
jgi:preprotein translocase subunit SecD